MDSLGRHPIEERTDLPMEEQVRRLYVKVAQLWDQVWWLSLSSEQRAHWEAQGFTAPIAQFYEDAE